MTRHPFVIADVFTDRPYSGNQLAVVFDADGLTKAQMQAVAAEFGFSETTFVLRPERDDHDVRVRIFTPGTELPFAGHPTVGTALALAWRKEPGERPSAVVLGEGAGPVPVELRYAGGEPVAAEFRAPALPARGGPVEGQRCVAALGLEPRDLVLADGLPGEASCGLPFLLVRLASREALERARMLDPGLFDGLSADAVYLFVEEGEEIRARMFSPLDGIGEDPATGSAAAALAGFLGSVDAPDGTRRWRIRQGVEMGRPSLIEASARRHHGRVAEVRVGGSAIMIAEGWITPPPG
jgi:trans-2,3-dihydro-3-hydroxyanthranilate isomerase